MSNHGPASAFGESRTRNEWCAHFGIGRAVVDARLSRGATLEEALSRPVRARACNPNAVRRRRMVAAFGETHSVAEWARLVGIKERTLAGRLREPDADPEECITRPRVALSTAQALGRKVQAANAKRRTAERHELAEAQRRSEEAEAVLPTPGKRAEASEPPAPPPRTKQPATKVRKPEANTPDIIAKPKSPSDPQPHDDVEVAGAIRSVAEWCELGGLPIKLVRDRLQRGVPLARAVSMPRPGPATLTAHGLTLTLEQWSTRCGVPVGTLKSRMRTRFAGEGTWTDERIVSTPFTPTNKRQGPKYQVEPGAPDSISWEVEPWATDPVAQEMVRKNPGGMLVEAVCAATGLRDSQCRQVEAIALHKLRVAALSGDRAAVEFLGSMTGDTRDAEELIDILAENFPRADCEALAALEDMEALALGRLEVEPSNDGMDEELAQLGYATAWAA